jgi:putative membrane protein
MGVHPRFQGIVQLRPCPGGFHANTPVVFQTKSPKFLRPEPNKAGHDERKIMKTKNAIGLILATAILQAAVGTAMGQQIQKKGGSASADQRFVTAAALNGDFAAQLGQMAVDTSSNSDVVALGQELVDDYSSSDGDLATLAGNNGFTTPDTLDKAHQKQLDNLSKLSGDKFDRAFARLAQSSEQKNLKLFQKESHSTQNTDLQDFTSNNIPVIQTHVENARTLSASLKGH